MGVPTRLKDWIRGYPAMLPTARNKKDKLQPRRGARTVRVVSVRRNVRLYTPDLVKTAASWGVRPVQSQSASNGLASSREWERVAPSTLKLTPRYADGYKKRMNLPANFHPYTTAGSNLSVSSTTSSKLSTLVEDSDYFGLGKGKETSLNEERFRSLTDLKWGEFEAMGFGGLGTDEKKLEFDLTESARTVRVPPFFFYFLFLTLLIDMIRTVEDSETINLDMVGFLQLRILTHRRSAQCDAAVQHAGCEYDPDVAVAAGRDDPQAEEDAARATAIRVGHGARRGLGRSHRGSIH